MEKESRGGIGFLGALTLIFVAAKLLNLVSWSWWFVFMPVIIPVMIVIVIAMVAACMEKE